MVKFSSLSTERLILRDFCQQDLPLFTAYRSDPEVARYQSWQNYDGEQAKLFFTAQQALSFGEPGSWYQIAIAAKHNDQMLGDCVIHFLPSDEQQVEIGFTLATEHQGQGYGKEAVGALMDYIFHHLHKHRIVAITDVDNAGCIGLLEGLRFRREAHFVENILFKGRWGSEYLYAMLKREYEVLVPQPYCFNVAPL